MWWADLTNVSWGILKLTFVHDPLDFLDFDDLELESREHDCHKDLQVSDLQTMTDQFRKLSFMV